MNENDKFELPNSSCSVSNIQDYFEYIIKKHKSLTDNLPIRIYVSKTENRITIKIKSRIYLKLLTPETIKLLERTKIRYLKIKMVKMYLMYRRLK